MSTSCLLRDRLTYDVDCPSSDWQAIQKNLDHASHSIPKSEQNHGGPVTPSEVEVTGRSSLRQVSFATEYASNGSDWVFGAAISST